MGKVIVNNVILKNHQDEIAVKLGVLEPDQVRHQTQSMIADSGAVEVSLPHTLVEQLGLPFYKKVRVRLADGSVKSLDIHDDLSVHVDDRSALVRCVVSPNPSAPCLLGQLVLEQIDYVVDCRNGRIAPNPDSEPGMMPIEM